MKFVRDKTRPRYILFLLMLLGPLRPVYTAYRIVRRFRR